MPHRRFEAVESQRPTRPLVDIPTVAEWLSVTERHVRRLVAERRVPYIKWGHLIRFDPADVEAWLRAKTVDVEDDASRLRSLRPANRRGPQDEGRRAPSSTGPGATAPVR